MKCLNCEKDFHSCQSCDFYYDWEQKYCSKKCWESSEEFKQDKEKIDKLVNSLDFERKKLLKFILDKDEYWFHYIRED